MNVGDFIYKSSPLSGVKGYYITADDLLNAYTKLSDIEKKSLVLHYIMDNSPFAFTDIYEKPLLFEQVRQYISHILVVDMNHIKLIGSTKTGFKMDSKNYVLPYSKASDLDFMIIDEALFLSLAKEYDVWRNAYLDDSILKPRTDYEKKCWDDNMVTLRRSIDLGFVDTYKMPNRQEYLPVNTRVNNTMSNVVRNLKMYHGFCAKTASMRVYKNVDCYYCQQNRNIEAILKAKGLEDSPK